MGTGPNAPAAGIAQGSNLWNAGNPNVASIIQYLNAQRASQAAMGGQPAAPTTDPRAAWVAAHPGQNPYAPSTQTPTITQNLSPNNPSVSGYNPIPPATQHQQYSPPLIDPAAPAGSNWGQPNWWPVRVPDAPGIGTPTNPFGGSASLGATNAKGR